MFSCRQPAKDCLSSQLFILLASRNTGQDEGGLERGLIADGAGAVDQRHAATVAWSTRVPELPIYPFLPMRVTVTTSVSETGDAPTA